MANGIGARSNLSRGGINGPGQKRVSRARYGICASATRESDNCRAPSARFEWRVAKVQHARVARQNASHHFALNSDAASVDNAERSHVHPFSLGKIFFDDGANVARMHCVQIEHIGDRDPDRIIRVVALIHPNYARAGARQTSVLRDQNAKSPGRITGPGFCRIQRLKSALEFRRT